MTDVVFVHGRDDFGLLADTPDLLSIGELVTKLEHAHALAFDRATATIRTNLPVADAAIRAWLARA